jgi:hypothetical protein
LSLHEHGDSNVTGDEVAAAMQTNATAAIVKVLARVIATVHIHFVIVEWRTNGALLNRLNYWEIIADNLSKAGWSWGCVSTVHFDGRTIWVADAHRSDGKRFVARAD